MKGRARGGYFVPGEGILTFDRSGNATAGRPSAAADARTFRFSRGDHPLAQAGRDGLDLTRAGLVRL